MGSVLGSFHLLKTRKLSSRSLIILHILAHTFHSCTAFQLAPSYPSRKLPGEKEMHEEEVQYAAFSSWCLKMHPPETMVKIMGIEWD